LAATITLFGYLVPFFFLPCKLLISFCGWGCQCKLQVVLFDGAF
jgi:hypothetical protein